MKNYKLANGLLSGEFKIGDKFKYENGIELFDTCLNFGLRIEYSELTETQVQNAVLIFVHDDGSSIPMFKVEGYETNFFAAWSFLVPVEAN